MALTKVRNRMVDFGGGIYLGGTGAGNLLSEYEEGTWTPSNISTGTVTATYTKIGNIVTISLTIAPVSGAVTLSSAILAGLPFATATSAPAPWYSDNFVVGTGNVRKAIASGTSIYLRVGPQSTGSYASLSDLTGTYFNIVATYRTNA